MALVRMAIVVLACLLARADRAEATCGRPSWNGTAAGPVPLRGVLYVYDEAFKLRPMEVQWIGSAGVVTQTPISPSVVRIAYEGPAGSELVVNEVPYRLTSDWHAPPLPPRAVNYWHDEHQWTCSSTDSLNVELDQPTAVVRARWTYKGTTNEWLVPAQGTVVELGKINCGGTTIDPSELRAGGHLDLVAVRLDGSEVPVWGLPNTIATSALGLSTRFWVIALFVLGSIPLALSWRRRMRAIAMSSGG